MVHMRVWKQHHGESCWEKNLDYMELEGKLHLRQIETAGVQWIRYRNYKQHIVKMGSEMLLEGEDLKCGS